MLDVLLVVGAGYTLVVLFTFALARTSAAATKLEDRRAGLRGRDPSAHVPAVWSGTAH